MNSLTEHLQQFGIRQFPNSAYYWEWAAKRLGRRLAARVNRVRQPLIEERATAEDLLRFYDFTADPRVSGVVHSMKADAIRACGAFCARLLQGAGGYLT